MCAFCISIFNLLKKLFKPICFEFAIIFTERGCELAKEFFLLGAEVSGGLYNNGEDEVALSTRVDVCNTLAANGELLACLCSLRNGELFSSATKHWDVYLCAESRLCKGDWNFAKQVVAIALEDLVFLNSYLNDKVAVHTAVSAHRALSALNDSLHMVNTCRNLNFEGFFEANVALAVTILTGIFNDFARTLTR